MQMYVGRDLLRAEARFAPFVNYKPVHRLSIQARS